MAQSLFPSNQNLGAKGNRNRLCGMQTELGSLGDSHPAQDVHSMKA